MTTATSPKLRRCQLVAESVAVLCPHCGESQPNQDGSELWIASDFAKLTDARRQCVACDGPILVSHEPKAQFLKRQAAST